jgi:hypothetical protein|tara:strand:- start:539 stop:751 length:213 start_codon:yes stop_codon:yes gene_type:complete
MSNDFDFINDKFIDIIQSNDWDFPVVIDEPMPEPDIFAQGFFILPIPQEVVRFWQELLDTQEDDGNFFNQ